MVKELREVAHGTPVTRRDREVLPGVQKEVDSAGILGQGWGPTIGAAGGGRFSGLEITTARYPGTPAQEDCAQGDWKPHAQV